MNRAFAIVMVLGAGAARAEDRVSDEPSPGVQLQTPSFHEVPRPAAIETPAPAPVAAPVPEGSLVVTGTRTPRRVADDPIGTEVVGARELAARNVKDASRALEAEPGIQVERSFRGSSFQLRGLDAKYVRILVDGQPIMGQVNDVIDLRRFSTDGIERIEVVKGATSALYGSDALAGVVNLISRKPRKSLELSGFGQFGILNQSMAGITAGSRRGDFAGSMSLNWFGNSSYDLTPGDENLQTNGDARRAGTLTLRGWWIPSEKLEVMTYARAGYFDSRGVDLQPPRALYNRNVDELETSGGGQLHVKPDASSHVGLFVQANRFARSFYRKQRGVESAVPEDMQSVETLLRSELVADRKVLESTTILVGGGTQHAGFDSPRIEGRSAAVFSGWGFAQAEVTPAKWLDLVVGGRVDLDAKYGVHASPRAALRLGIPAIEGASVRIAYGEGFRAPSFGERFLKFHNPAGNYTVFGKSDLRPEVSSGEQAGFEWAPRSFMFGGQFQPAIRVGVFHNDLNDLIQPLETADSNAAFQQFQYANYNTAQVTGAEAGARVTAGNWLVADLGFTWLDATATLDGKTTPLPGRAGLQATANVILQSASGFEISLRQQLLGNRTALDDGTTLSAIYLADFRIGKRLWEQEDGRGQAGVYVNCDNLANVTEPDFLSLPGRMVSAGVNAKY